MEQNDLTMRKSDAFFDKERQIKRGLFYSEERPNCRKHNTHFPDQPYAKVAVQAGNPYNPAHSAIFRMHFWSHSWHSCKVKKFSSLVFCPTVPLPTASPPPANAKVQSWPLPM